MEYTLIRPGEMDTLMGKSIPLNCPTSADIELEDIVGSLSKICRFGGHIHQFYSVAQHSVLVAMMVPAHLKREALMHDATEAYVGDVIKPLKMLLGDTYAVLESRFEKAIASRFELRTDEESKMVIKYYDRVALELEHAAFRVPANERARLMATLLEVPFVKRITFNTRSWSDAAALFLEYWHDYDDPEAQYRAHSPHLK